MTRVVISAFVLALLISACAATRGTSVGVRRATSGSPREECRMESDHCASNADCCSSWCFDGTCERVEP